MKAGENEVTDEEWFLRKVESMERMTEATERLKRVEKTARDATETAREEIKKLIAAAKAVSWKKRWKTPNAADGNKLEELPEWRKEREKLESQAWRARATALTAVNEAALEAIAVQNAVAAVLAWAKGDEAG
jgi:hypothetical protein